MLQVCSYIQYELFIVGREPIKNIVIYVSHYHSKHSIDGT